METEQEEWITNAVAAEILGCSVGWINTLGCNGTLQRKPDEKHIYLYPKSGVLAYKALPRQAPNRPRYISRLDALELMGISTTWLTRLGARGELRRKKVGSEFRYLEEDVRAYKKRLAPEKAKKVERVEGKAEKVEKVEGKKGESAEEHLYRAKATLELYDMGGGFLTQTELIMLLRRAIETWSKHK